MTEISVSWSELKSFQRCPKQWDYKYAQRLVPKKKSRPLFLGSWIHACLEAYYRGQDWHEGHQIFLNEYNKLFEEEKLELDRKGRPLPKLVEQIMRSYLWYYREDGWQVHAIEQEFEVDTPLPGVSLKGIIDLIVRDADGLLWVVDHKTTTTIPDAHAFHGMDPQLMLYPWAAKRAWGLDIAGIYYNYVRSRAPTVPRINNDGSLSRRKIVTDYPTLFTFLKRNGYDPTEFRDQLRPLRKESPFLRRYRYPRESYVTKEILTDALATAKRIQGTERRIRVITRDCARMCSYHDLCRAELNGFDTKIMRHTNFTLKPEKEKEDLFGDFFDDEDDRDEE